jgi:hypothetical protein
MDQEPLVREEIDAGRKFLDEFDKRIPVRAAFWLKASEDSGWYLHVASDQVSDRNIRAAYGEVGKVAEMIDDPNFNLFRVKLIGVNHPLSQAALEIYQRHSARVPIYVRDGSFGGISVEGVYVYPPSLSAVNT